MMESISMYEKIAIRLPSRFSPMTEQEQKQFYPTFHPDYAYVDSEEQSVLCVLKQDNQLEKQDVEKKIAEYQAIYARMAPGFQMGELMLRKENAFNMGILTYKSNALTRDLFNVLAVMNYDGKEVLIHIACSIDRAFDELPQFTKILQSVNITEDDPAYNMGEENGEISNNQ